MDIFKILAAILHLGNVQITAVGHERSSVSVSAALFPLPVVRGSPAECLMVTLLLHFSTRHPGPAGQTSCQEQGSKGSVGSCPFKSRGEDVFSLCFSLIQ